MRSTESSSQQGFDAHRGASVSAVVAYFSAGFDGGMAQLPDQASLRASDNGSMSNPSHSDFAQADHLLFASHVLRALENGQMRMHASDYQEIADWVSREMGHLDTEKLQALMFRVPIPTRDIVENLLHQRQERMWCYDDLARRKALIVWRSLHMRL